MPVRHTARLVLCSLLALSPVLSTGLAAPAPLKPGSVQGQVLDTGGRPVEGVTVWIKPVVTTGVAQALTDENGRYEVSGLPPVGYRAYAWLGVRFQGQKFCYRLALPKTSEYNPFVPNEGVVRNFQWKLSGRVPDFDDDESSLGYFGGSVSPLRGGDFSDRSTIGNDRVNNDDQIELQLTPVGPLIDGSAGRTITRTVPALKVAVDVPIGTYKVKATLISEDGRREAVDVAADRNAAYGAEATIKFKGTDGGCAGGYGGGAGSAYVYWRFH